MKKSSFHFERFIGTRRVAAVILTAKSTARAWGELRRMLKAEVKS